MKSAGSNADLHRLVLASLFSRVGTQISVVAAPLAALTLLHASTLQVGLLGVCEFSPYLLFGLRAGAVVDQHSRQRIMVVCDALRSMILGLLVVGAVLSDLHLWQLYVALFGVGTLTVFHDIAAQAFLPSISDRSQLARGNRLLVTTDSLASTAGPSIGGLLISATGALTALLTDAFSYIVSAVLLLRIDRTHERAPSVRSPGRPWPLIREGLRFVIDHPHLRPITMATASASLFATMQQGVFVTYLVRSLGFGAGRVGLILAVGNVGIILGAAVAGRMLRRVPLGRLLWVCLLGGGVGQLALGLLPRRGASFTLPIAWAVATAFIAVFNIAQVTYRQIITDDAMRGRMNATMRFSISGMLPVGYLLGALVGAKLGLHEALVIAGAGATVSFMWLIASPVRSLHTQWAVG